MRPTKTFPLITLAVVGAAIVASLFPTLARALVYDRTAIASGQWWRLLTGNWIHFGADHLFYDALAVGITSWMIEWRDRRGLALLLATAAGAVGLATFLLAPSVTHYGGLSGIACATVGYLVVLGIMNTAWHRLFYAFALAVLATKVGWESVMGCALFVNARPDVALLPLAHAVGLAAGASQAVIRARSPVTPASGRKNLHVSTRPIAHAALSIDAPRGGGATQ